MSAAPPANSAVSTPTHATTWSASPLASKNGCARAIRYTPAVTMVAAWIRAETGVGPSIASVSQGKSGIWALFPTAASRSSSATAVTIVLEAPDAAAPVAP